MWRFLRIWGHVRWNRCYQFENKHQWVKALWKNTNGKDKPLQVLLKLFRKMGLIHVLSGGYWFREYDGETELVKMGTAATAHLCNRNSLAHRVFANMTCNDIPEPECDVNPFKSIDEELVVCLHIVLTCFLYESGHVSGHLYVSGHVSGHLSGLIWFVVVQDHGIWSCTGVTSKEVFATNRDHWDRLQPLVDSETDGTGFEFTGKAYYVKSMVDSE